MGQPAESLRVEVPTPAGTVSLVDARPGTGDDGPIRTLERYAGPAFVAVRAQADVFRLELDRELRVLAGTDDLPPSVQARAHLAVDTMVQQRLLSLAASGSAGRWARAATKLAESSLDEDIVVVEKRESALTNVAKHAAGLAVLCRDLLESARAAARAVQADQAGGVVPGLMGRLGVAPARTGSMETHGSEKTQPAAEVRPEPPISPPGEVSLGAPPSQTGAPKTEKDPNGQTTPQD